MRRFTRTPYYSGPRLFGFDLLNIGFTEPVFRLQTVVFPTVDSLSINSATASKAG